MNGRSSPAAIKMTTSSTKNYAEPTLGLRRLLAGFALTLAAGTLRGQETAQYFRQNCASCHTIGGGRLTGPDLKDVTKRKERD